MAELDGRINKNERSKKTSNPVGTAFNPSPVRRLATVLTPIPSPSIPVAKLKHQQHPPSGHSGITAPQGPGSVKTGGSPLGELDLPLLIRRQPGLALRAPPCEPLEAARRPKRLSHDPVSPRALFFLVDLRVLLSALELALKPVRTELHHMIHEGLEVLMAEERAERKGMDPRSVQGFILNDVPCGGRQGGDKGRRKNTSVMSPIHNTDKTNGSWHDGGGRAPTDDGGRPCHGLRALGQVTYSESTSLSAKWICSYLPLRLLWRRNEIKLVCGPCYRKEVIQTAYGS